MVSTVGDFGGSNDGRLEGEVPGECKPLGLSKVSEDGKLVVLELGESGL